MSTCNESHTVGHTHWICIGLKDHAPGLHYFVKAGAR